MDELKACPFCGNKQGNGMGIRTGTNDVYCQCGVLKPSHGWNARPIEEALRARIAELEEVLKNYANHRNWDYATMSDKCKDVFACGGNGWEDAEEALKGSDK
jgi:hypothetical protein